MLSPPRGRFGKALGGLAIAVCLSLAPEALPAEEVLCPSQPATVEAGDPTLARSICETVTRTSEFLATCGLSVTDPVLILVSDDAPGLVHGCLGLFDCDTGQIRLRTPRAMADLRTTAEPHFEVEATVLFESIVAHEWAHAAFEQSACESARCADNHEYVAHVAQMWSLPEDVRSRMLDRVPEEHTIDPSLLNAFIAALAPDRYAALAWKHFSAPGNGCAFIGDLAAGRTTLQLLPD